MNFVKFLRTPFLVEHLRWLLLNLMKSSANNIRYGLAKTVNIKKGKINISNSTFKKLLGDIFNHKLTKITFWNFAKKLAKEFMQ